MIEEAHGKSLRVAALEYALEDAKELVADGVGCAGSFGERPGGG